MKLDDLVILIRMILKEDLSIDMSKYPKDIPLNHPRIGIIGDDADELVELIERKSKLRFMGDLNDYFGGEGLFETNRNRIPITIEELAKIFAPSEQGP